MDAVIYVRVSDAKQAEAEVSIPAQIDACQKKAVELGATVLKVYRDEGRSAFTGTRPEFNAAVDDACRLGVRYFICWSSSRFARNRIDAAMAKHLLDSARVQIVYVSTPIDRETESGWAFDGFMEIVDELYSRRNSADTTRSMLELARAGFFCGGTPPLGYQAAPAADNPKRKRLRINESEAATVREIFALRAKGSGSVAIAEMCNARGMRNRGRKWSRSTVLALLRNECVIGNTVFGRRPKGSNTLRPRDEWIIVRSHDPIIDEATWDLVQSLMDDAKDACKSGSPHSTHPFTGILVCGHCGASLQTTTGKGRTKRYSYYQCRRAMLKEGCTAGRLRADVIDEQLTDAIFDRLFSPKHLREIAEALRERQGAWTRDQAQRRRDLVSRIRDLEQRQSRLFDLLELHGRDAPDLSDMTERLRMNKTAITSLKQEIAAIDATPPPYVGAIDEWAKEIGAGMREVFTTPEAARKARAFYRTFITRIEAKGEDLQIHYEPARLLTQNGPVPSTVIWLPEHGVLGTTTLLVRRASG
jgi:DNA invertase Pin-like site-specific DNA recombinase